MHTKYIFNKKNLLKSAPIVLLFIATLASVSVYGQNNLDFEQGTTGGWP